MSSSAGLIDGLVAPAYRWVPPHVETYGPEVADLADSAGMTLDLEQRLVLDGMYAVDQRGQLVCTEHATIAPRQNVKTHVHHAAALADLVLFDEPLALWTAHVKNPACDESIRFLQGLFLNYDHLRRLVRDMPTGNGEEAIELLSGARLEFVARGANAGRALSGSRITLDEGLLLTDSHMGSLLPTLAAKSLRGMSVQVRYASSAAKLQSTVLHSVVRRGRAGGAKSLGYIEWCAPPTECGQEGCDHWPGTEGCALDRHDLLAQANCALDRRIGYEFVVNTERYGMSAAEFMRERMGWHEMPPETESGIDLNVWRRLGDPRSHLKAERPRLSLCLDVMPGGRSAAISVASFRADGRQHLEVIEHRPGTAWAPARLKELETAYDPCCIPFDPAGPAGALQAEIELLGVTLDLLTAREVAQACTQFVNDVADKSRPLVHLGQRQVETAIKGAVAKDAGDGLVRFVRQSSDVDISPLMSLAMAKRGRDLHADDDYDVADSLY